MKPVICWSVLAALILAPAHIVLATTAEEKEFLLCGQILRAQGEKKDTYVERQYAPDRKVDILHIAIDVTPDFKARTITGVTTIQFAPIARALDEFALDAIDLDVTSVTCSGAMSDYSVADKKITVRFSPPVPPGQKTTLVITYSAEPKQGLYFRTPELGYSEEDMHLFSQGETHGAPYWYPSYDYPNERSTSEVTCRVPSDMVVLSNGRLISERIDPNTGLKAVTWFQGKPHVNYLIALTAGRLKKVESRYRDIPLAFYVPASKVAMAANSFEGTADMIAFYEQVTGIAYPWDKYYQAAVTDFVAGGMENTSLTILNDGTLFTPETENIHSSQSLVAHELVHQWFGDYVTCKDWSHVWLNEGFATYYEDLYNGYKNGRDAMLYELYQTCQYMLRDRPDEKPIVWRAYSDADDQFDYRTYSKGGWVLRMLSAELGEDLFRQCVKTYLERNALGCVVTGDFLSVVEELSGRSFDRFFDQWVNHAGFPKLTVSYEWLGRDRLAKLSVRQTQDINENVSLFHFRTKVRFLVSGKPVDKEITVDEKEHDFYFPLEKEPTVVRFDPDYELLAQVTFNKPTGMLYAQLADQNDVVGRLLAIKALKEKKDSRTISHLKTALNGDSLWGVRISASRALREIHTDDAFKVLAESMEQTDARVRVQVVRDIAGFYRPQCHELMMKVLEKEKNPEIIAVAVENLGRYHTPETHSTVLRYLKSESYRNCLARAAVDAIHMLDEPNFIEPLKELASKGHRGWPVWEYRGALNTLAHIARNEEDKTAVREYLAGYVNHPSRSVQAGAIAALGTLGDPKAIPIIRTFVGSEPSDDVEQTAKIALTELQEQKKLVPQEIIELRGIVDDLKKENQKLSDELKEIKDRLDAKKDEKDTTGDKQPAKAADPIDD